MKTISRGETVTFSTAMRGGALATLVACALASPAIGAPLVVQALQNQSANNFFVLDFGAGIPRSEANIATTTYELELDAVARTARFLSYEQDIASLMLPDGTMTGAIHVSIVDSASVDFDPATGVFGTSDLYRVSYANDLSIYGLPNQFNPGGYVDLESASVGTVDVLSAALGTVFMEWAGAGQLLHPFPSFPGELIGFEYTCTMNAVFAVGASSFITLELKPLVEDTDMPVALETTLIGHLDAAIASLDLVPSQPRGAVSSLGRFIGRVRSSVPPLAFPDAQQLVNKANEVIRLIQYPTALPLFVPGMPSDDGSTGISKRSR